jgi:hypothetical protein
MALGFYDGLVVGLHSQDGHMQLHERHNLDSM